MVSHDTFLRNSENKYDGKITGKDLFFTMPAIRLIGMTQIQEVTSNALSFGDRNY
jgi:hypothetical protein